MNQLFIRSTVDDFDGLGVSLDAVGEVFNVFVFLYLCSLYFYFLPHLCHIFLQSCQGVL